MDNPGKIWRKQWATAFAVIRKARLTNHLSLWIAPFLLAGWLSWIFPVSADAQGNNPPVQATGLPRIQAIDLPAYASDDSNMVPPRVSIEGVVLSEFAPGCWFVHDSHIAFRIRLANASPLKRGDEIIATGTPVIRVGTPWLIDVGTVVTGQGTIPIPKKLDVRDAVSGRHDSEYVTVSGTVAGYADYKNMGGTNEVLLIDSDGVNCKVIFPAGTHSEKLYAIGTLADFTGVCRHGNFVDGSARGALYVHVVVHGPEAVRVIWTNTASWILVGGVAVVIFAVVTFALLKWRQARLIQGSELRFRALIENSFDLIIVLNPDLSMKYVSPSALRFAGPDWKSGSALLVIHPEDRAMLGRLFEEIRTSSGSTRRIPDCRLLAQDGEVVYAEAIVSNCLHLAGVEGIVMNVRDVNERKQAEEKLRGLNSDLEKRVADRTTELNIVLAGEREVNRLKTNFTSMVTHEIRTPLEVILSSTEILLRYLDRLSPEKRTKHLLTIRAEIQRMSSLMQDVLLFSRAEAGRIEFHPAPLDLKNLCKQLVDEIQSATGQRCPIQLQVGDSMESARADENLLRHTFANLLNNAVKYSPAGTRVSFSVSRDDGTAIFVVQDSGMGIPEEDRQWLFTPFHRGKNVATIQGTGLGLVIVKHCVQRHGGTIEIQSQPATGTTITVQLPLFSPSLTEFVQRLSKNQLPL
jgi:PAS domain S-box-containing protein